VTSCSSDFKPTFRLPLSSPNGSAAATVTVNQTRFTEVIPRREEVGIHADYNTGASADQYYYDLYYGANPGFYKSFAWGLNDACPDWYRLFSTLSREGVAPGLNKLNYHGYVLTGGTSVARFRSHAQVNTFAETSVLPTAKAYGFPRLRLGLHIGVDRILIRTATFP
jgi:hypothetical protein